MPNGQTLRQKQTGRSSLRIIKDIKGAAGQYSATRTALQNYASGRVSLLGTLSEANLCLGNAALRAELLQSGNFLVRCPASPNIGGLDE